MHRIRLISFNRADPDPLSGDLRAAGYQVEAGPPVPGLLRAMKTDPPAAVVIDLCRQPSVGRDVAVGLRHAPATRRVPLVLVGGDAEKVARLRELLPDATYTTAEDLRAALAQAIAHPPANPVRPASVFAAYAGTPLPRKLGITSGATVALVDAPDGFEATLGELPGGVTLTRDTAAPRNLTLWFIRARADLDARLPDFLEHATRGGLWILWPKKASPLGGDLTQVVVRKAGLAAGLVDYKVCAVDATWTGLRFSRRA